MHDAVTALLVGTLALPVALLTAGCSRPSAATSTLPAGPVIARFGRVHDVPAAGLATPVDEDVKVRFDVSRAAKPGHLNTGFETVARFLNMHARAGMAAERMHLALVIHGPAVDDTLTTDAAHARHGRDNPNAELVEALAGAGVRVYVCGQTAAESGITRDEITPGARLALSAMTAHHVLAREGYELNPF